MLSRTLILFLAVIVGIAWSYEVSSSEARKIRQKRDKAPSIIIGSDDTQVNNTFVIGQSGNGAPGSGSVFVGGSVVNQNNNDYLIITDTGKLIISMPDVVNLQDPLEIPGLDDSQVEEKLNITHQQRNAQVIFNLKHSLQFLQDLCREMTEKADKYLLENTITSIHNQNFYPECYHRRMWNTSQLLHMMGLNSMHEILGRLITRINLREDISDSVVSETRNKVRKLLASHKKFERAYRDVVGPSN